MKKKKSQKVLQWTTKDIVLNVFTYFINTLIIAALFIGTIYLQSRDGSFSFVDYFDNPNSFLHFFILLLLIVALMASYFFFEDKDFLKSAVKYSS